MRRPDELVLDREDLLSIGGESIFVYDRDLGDGRGVGRPDLGVDASDCVIDRLHDTNRRPDGVVLDAGIRGVRSYRASCPAPAEGRDGESTRVGVHAVHQHELRTVNLDLTP